MYFECLHLEGKYSKIVFTETVRKSYQKDTTIFYTTNPILFFSFSEHHFTNRIWVIASRKMKLLTTNTIKIQRTLIFLMIIITFTISMTSHLMLPLLYQPKAQMRLTWNMFWKTAMSKKLSRIHQELSCNRFPIITRPKITPSLIKTLTLKATTCLIWQVSGASIQLLLFFIDIHAISDARWETSRFFLSLRFYVKSKLGILEVQHLPFQQF